MPAYGRDYKNKTLVKEDWHGGKDFLYQGRYLSIRDVPQTTQVWVRYARHTKLVRVQ
jgi:nitrogen fixation protein